MDELTYGYVPNLGANVAGAVLFGLILVCQLILGNRTKERFFALLWNLAASLEFVGYVCRIVGHNRPYGAVTEYQVQQVILLMGPAYMAGGLYYQLAALVTVYGRQFGYVSPRKYIVIFAALDCVALAVQTAGGAVAASSDSDDSANTGRWVAVGGMCFQVATLTAFVLLFAHTLHRIHKAGEVNWTSPYSQRRHRKLFKYWVPAVFVSLLFLEIRSIYRVVELANGWTSYLTRNEAYNLALDGLMIFLGLLPLTIIHPGVAYGRISIRHPGRYAEGEKDENNVDEVHLNESVYSS